MRADFDSGYKQLFSHPEMVRDLLQAFLPYSWAGQLQLAALERINASYVGGAGAQRHDDMVWRLHVGGEIVYVYLLLEFQSSNDRWMVLRMQVYVGLLYQDLIKRHQLGRSGRLPPVLPIVLYGGRRAWTASQALSDLVLPAPEGLGGLQRSSATCWLTTIACQRRRRPGATWSLPCSVCGAAVQNRRQSSYSGLSAPGLRKSITRHCAKACRAGLRGVCGISYNRRRWLPGRCPS